ncbi:MAG: methyltransferase domain-containing protein, partial [Armatimonadota bacterium]|nr:methyltransferase domain-containing protein [Armatimonadota bacterium]
PLAIKAVTRRDENIGKDSGLIYGANTVGTLVGSLLAGLVLIPILGLRESLVVAVALNMIIGAMLLAGSKLPQRWICITSGSLVIAAIIFMLPQWHPASFSRGTFRMRMVRPPATWKAFRSLLSQMKVFYVGEDGSARVAVASAENIKGKYDRMLTIDGKPDGTSWGDMPTQVLFGQIPMFFKLDAKNVLVIGLGTGATAGSVLTHPNTHVDCVEISPAVAKALRYFDDVNWAVRKNPRFNLIIEDARTVVAVSKKKYDVVISEPSNPWMAGIGNLFSLEFFQSVDRVLKPGGVLAQWFHSYEMSDELVAMIIRTVRRVFPYVYIFEVESDYILLASREPISPDFAGMEKRMAIDAIKQDLRRISITSLAALLCRQIMSPETAAEVAGEGPVNCDDLPILEFRAPRSFYIGEVAECMNSNDERKWGNDNLFSAQYMRIHRLTREDYRSLLVTYLDSRTSHPALLIALFKHYLEKWPNDAEMLKEYAKAIASTEPLTALKAIHSAAQVKPTLEALELESDILFSEIERRQSIFSPQDFTPVLDLLDRAIKLDPANDSLQEKRRQVVELMR